MNARTAKDAFQKQDRVARNPSPTFKGDRRSWSDRRSANVVRPENQHWSGSERRLADRRATQTVALLWQRRKYQSAG